MITFLEQLKTFTFKMHATNIFQDKHQNNTVFFQMKTLHVGANTVR